MHSVQMPNQHISDIERTSKAPSKVPAFTELHETLQGKTKLITNVKQARLWQLIFTALCN